MTYKKEWVVINNRIGSAHIGRDGQIKDFRQGKIVLPLQLDVGKTVKILPAKGVNISPLSVPIVQVIKYKYFGHYMSKIIEFYVRFNEKIFIIEDCDKYLKIQQIKRYREKRRKSLT